MYIKLYADIGINYKYYLLAEARNMFLVNNRELLHERYCINISN